MDWFDYHYPVSRLVTQDRRKLIDSLDEIEAGDIILFASFHELGAVEARSVWATQLWQEGLHSLDPEMHVGTRNQTLCRTGPTQQFGYGVYLRTTRTVKGYCYHGGLHSLIREPGIAGADKCDRCGKSVYLVDAGYYDTLHHFGNHAKRTPLRPASDDPLGIAASIENASTGGKSKTEPHETEDQYIKKFEWMWTRTTGHRSPITLSTRSFSFPVWPVHSARPRFQVSTDTPKEISQKWLHTGYVELEYRAPHGKVLALLLRGTNRDKIARKLKVSRRTIDMRCEDIVMPAPVPVVNPGDQAMTVAAGDGWRWPQGPCGQTALGRTALGSFTGGWGSTRGNRASGPTRRYKRMIVPVFNGCKVREVKADEESVEELGVRVVDNDCVGTPGTSRGERRSAVDAQYATDREWRVWKDNQRPMELSTWARNFTGVDSEG